MIRRHVVLFLVSVGGVMFGLALIGYMGGYRLNLTPSEPLGLWRIAPLHRPIRIGDLMFVCPPETAGFAEALKRGYLRRGLCTGGFAPLIKTIVALPGQRLDIGATVAVDGRTIRSSTVRKKDGKGRTLTPFTGGTVPPHHLFLHSSFASSYDSRYFGPLPDAGLLGLAQQVVTFDP
jgi:conjugative transfer signal peptidase TraF